MANEMDLQSEIARLTAENEKLRAKQEHKISLKISEKGCMSIYGLSSRFPVSLYRSQAERLFSDESVAQVRQFIRDNESKLPLKPVKE